MQSCIFCEIMVGRSPASMLYADELACAFLTIGPVNPGHLLVIPKQHIPSLEDLDEEIGAHLFKVTMQMAKALRLSGLQCDGVNLLLSDGEAAFQDVFHVHMHVIPRFKGDPFKIKANWDIKPSRAQLDEVAAKIRYANASLRQRNMS